jgi:general stress protein 26
MRSSHAVARRPVRASKTALFDAVKSLNERNLQHLACAVRTSSAKSRAVQLAVLGVTLQLLILPAIACAQCIIFDKPEDLFGRADAVFLGKVISTAPTGNQGDHVVVEIATLRVDKFWKGDLAREVRVSADAPFSIGTTYLVFAGGKPLSTTIPCRATEPQDRAGTKLEWLGRHAVPRVPAKPGREEIIAAARDIMQKARHCSLITVGDDGHPQARIVDPLEPDSDFTVWIATNPLTRKVREIRRNPRTTLLCFDTATSSYVTVVGRASLITDAADKQKHWKADWAPVYPQGARDDGFVLIRMTPARLEIVSESRGIVGDPKTWLPLAIEFPNPRR